MPCLIPSQGHEHFPNPPPPCQWPIYAANLPVKLTIKQSKDSCVWSPPTKTGDPIPHMITVTVAIVTWDLHQQNTGTVNGRHGQNWTIYLAPFIQPHYFASSLPHNELRINKNVNQNLCSIVVNIAVHTFLGVGLNECTRTCFSGNTCRFAL